MEYRWATAEEATEADNALSDKALKDDVLPESISPEGGWACYMYDPMMGSEAWWFVTRDTGDNRWVVGYITSPSEVWDDGKATREMMAWYWEQMKEKTA